MRQTTLLLGLLVLACEPPYVCPDDWSASSLAMRWARQMQLPNPVAECEGNEGDCAHAICNVSWDSKEGRRVQTFYCDQAHCYQYK